MKNETILLKDLQDLLTNKQKYFQSEVKGETPIPEGRDGSQGDYNETFRFYKHPGLPEGVFMRETYHSDSYGYNQSLNSVEFVKGREKTITVFEPI